METPPAEGTYPENPVLARVWRGQWVESQHRGAWVLVDASGQVLEGAGQWDEPFFARSSIKSLQAVPLLETGAAARWNLTDPELVLALASHNGEAQHTEVVAGLLARIGLSEEALQCGPHPPGDVATRIELGARGELPSRLHNNCSGKHAGFLALALHLGQDPATYLDPTGECQRLVRAAVATMTGTAEDEFTIAVDGCSAPTFRMPLTAIATGFARVANPEGLDPALREHCRRMTTAVATYPELVAGVHKRMCTNLSRASEGRLFAKIGAEAVYAIGDVGHGRALAVKVDDGSTRGLHAIVTDLVERKGLLSADALESFEHWRGRSLRNWAGLEVGRIEVIA